MTDGSVEVVSEGNWKLFTSGTESPATGAGRFRILVHPWGAVYAGLSLLVDQLRADVRGEVEPVTAVARAAELRPA